ncbi:flagellar assembly peptidoglycan hydrolase FlgJ [Granulosicoccus antarcticus]|uniref:Peptidoglycan hydrolase FlgJ n=1 Tax=Granulosicoccus antarcticus IMCC3135 TaxID=1192854 RepID=A0A2Z2NK80_9GAMM|nr:flagellar assembly peptidoglycan hydrolase FlgJ [Granulosicoccus antarcticus]ASJ71802.1 Peptidoglycan hydrolase FlgJ [Granulosicoccus antarcticus IMCC3135]
MTELAPADLSALIQVQQIKSGSLQSRQSDNQNGDTAEQAKARDAANKFEALLIHNMLKSMRKTTMAENTSNQRAIYDDMLDKNLADSMIKAGGIGVAEQLMKQLHGNNATKNSEATSHTTGDKTATRDHLRLRELAMSINGNQRSDESSGSSAASQPTVSDKGLNRLKMLSRLWGQTESTQAGSTMAKTEFLQSLAPHAKRSAQRLGTTTSAVLAIAALETGWGQSMLKNETGQSSNNYFGIKAGAKDKDFTSNTTTEYLNGKSHNVQARFKSYDSSADSVEGFADFILENPRYSTALQHASNPERFLKELHVAGYATDPRYADKAITVMRQVEQQTSKP